MGFGEKLKELRLVRNWSQEEMGKFLGTSKQVISRYERSVRSPSISVANEYAARLGVPLDYFGEVKPSAEDSDIQKILEAFKNRPELQILFSSSIKATPDDIRSAAIFLDTLRKRSEQL